MAEKVRGRGVFSFWWLHPSGPAALKTCSPVSNCRPAKWRVRTTWRARKTQYDFAGECHSDLQPIGNTIHGSLPGCRYQFRRHWTSLGLFFLMAWLHKISRSGDAFYEHIRSHVMFFTMVLVWCPIWIHSHNAHDQLTHGTCQQGNTWTIMAPPSNRQCLEAQDR